VRGGGEGVVCVRGVGGGAEREGGGAQGGKAAGRQ